MEAPAAMPCQIRRALAEAAAKQGAAESAARVEAEVLHELRSFTDSFADALNGGFLAELDERRLRTRHTGQPETLRLLLARNRRTLTAQQALQTLYGKLLDRVALSVEEQALAEHARDLGRRGRATGNPAAACRWPLSPSPVCGRGAGESALLLESASAPLCASRRPSPRPPRHRAPRGGHKAGSTRS